MSLAQVFRDAAVARAYRQRAPYPEQTVAILERQVVGVVVWRRPVAR